MKALFISFNQAYNEEIVEVLERHGQRGFTRWDEVAGRGSADGEPHFGSHAWPVMNIAVLAFVEESALGGITSELKAKDEASRELGLRFFTWNVD